MTTLTRTAAALAAVLLLTAAAHGATRRSYTAIKVFKYKNPCPATGQRSGPCPGYVIDHIIPLACGGKDAPENMQWQTKEAAKAKDKWERRPCHSVSYAPTTGSTASTSSFFMYAAMLSAESKGLVASL